MIYTVYKYEIPPSKNGETERVVYIPAYAVFLRVEAIGDKIFLWAKVDPDALNVPRTFVVVGTGWTFDGDYLTHVGTAVMSGGDLIWHVFLKERH